MEPRTSTPLNAAHPLDIPIARRTSRVNPALVASAIFIAACVPAAAQQLNIGIIAGTNLNDDVRSGREVFGGGFLPSGETQFTTQVVHPGARRPILGIRMDLDLQRGWAVEFDALHREWKSTMDVIISRSPPPPGVSATTNLGPFTRTLTSWEFPLLAKYRFQLRDFHPFIALGPAFRPGGSGTGLSHVGGAADMGLEFRARGFRISPTLRYTRWQAKRVGFIIESPLRNQLEVLFAVDRPSSGFPARVFGRKLSVGVIAGIGLGKDFHVGNADPTKSSEGNSGIYGVMLESPVSGPWAVEVDGIYRPLHGSIVEVNQRVRFAHLTWEFPALAKYRFPATRRVVPFLAAGPAFRAEGNINLQPVSHFGATIAAGLESKFGLLKIAPSLRYTRWGRGPDTSNSRTIPNQMHVLVSFGF